MGNAVRRNRVVKIQTLGRFDVFIGGRPVTRWRAGKARNLLQYLLLRPGHVVPRDVLFEALWPGLDAPRGSLKVAVHMLRNILTEAGATGAGNDRISIVTQECGYSIETNDVWVDFQEFSELVLQTEQPGTSAEECTAKLQEAAEIYQGDFLPGVNLAWAEPQREWLRSLALSALHRLVADAEEQGSDLQVLNYCHKILNIDSLHEETYRTLIRLYGELGQLGQAERWYKLCATRLGDVIGINPSETTRAIYRKALSGELVNLRRPGPVRGGSGPMRLPASSFVPVTVVRP
jgi:DNA-binding SARP family transcriptional activator